MTDREIRTCAACQRPTPHLRPSTSHVLHLLLSLITVGVWLPVWLLVAQSNRRQGQCEVCGRRVGVFGAEDGRPIGLAIAAVVAILFVGKCSTYVADQRAATPVVSQTEAAQGACLMFIKARLHDPDSAEFQNSTHTSREGNIWTVRRPVRAKNALGAFRLAVYECTIRQDGEDLALVALKTLD